MNFTFHDEQLLFRRTVREFLEKECRPEHVRAMTTESSGRSPRLWKGLAELGVVGLTAPVDDGGLGKDETDLVLLLEEAGRAALPEPLVEAAAVVVPLVRDFAPADFRAVWLPRIASGEAIVTYSGILGPLAIDAHVASLVIVPAAEGMTAVPASDLLVTPIPSVDRTRRLFLFEGPTDGPGAVVIAGGFEAREAFAAAYDRGAFATAAVLCGIADRAIELASAYAKERRQFGKAIGSFQAVKHLLADALLGLEFARPAVYRAAFSIANGEHTRERDVSMAKALASDAATDACRAALQVHGAIGYTHEHDLHLWLNKAFALANAWGTAHWHRDRVARAVLYGRQ